MPLALLESLGRHGRLVLPAGLMVGILLPRATRFAEPFVPACVVLLLLVACLRVDPARLDWRRGATRLLFLVLLLQVALPVAFALALESAGVGLAWRVPVVLVAAAAPISGSPNLVLFLGGDPRLAVKLLLAGTALLPLTALPALYLLHGGGQEFALFRVAAILFAIILGCLWLAARLRPWLLRHAPERLDIRLDGLAAVLLALMVVGLLGALHEPANSLSRIGGLLVLAFALNFGLQWLGARLVGWRRPAERLSLGVVNGNRNIALFLTALPASLTEPLLLFIACYQVPMYLTPMLGRFLYGLPVGPRSC